MTQKPKIYCFSNVIGGGDGIAVAIAEDGTVLGSHWCSSERFVPYDLGVIEGCRADRHESYAKHYPNGYEMEFVRSSEVRTHVGLNHAIKLNNEQEPEVCDATEADSSTTAEPINNSKS